MEVASGLKALLLHLECGEDVLSCVSLSSSSSPPASSSQLSKFHQWFIATGGTGSDSDVAWSSLLSSGSEQWLSLLNDGIATLSAVATSPIHQSSIDNHKDHECSRDNPHLVLTAAYHKFLTVFDVAKQQLHSGVWSEVEDHWRSLYTWSCLGMAMVLVGLTHCTICACFPPSTSALLQREQQEKRERRHRHLLRSTIGILDHSLLMGAPSSVLRQRCHSFITLVEQRLNDCSSVAESSTSTSTSGGSSCVNAIAPSSPAVIMCDDEVDDALGGSGADDTEAGDLPKKRRRGVCEGSPDRLRCPSLEVFHRQYRAASQPCIITDAMHHWPAYSHHHRLEVLRHDDNYWRRQHSHGSQKHHHHHHKQQQQQQQEKCFHHRSHCRHWSNWHRMAERWEHRVVPVEIGANYMAPNWTQRLMSLGGFLRTFIINDTSTSLPPSSSPPSSPSPSPLASASASASPQPSSSASPAPIGYLAQHNLLQQIPALKGDLDIPDYCISPTDDVAFTTATEATSTIDNDNDDDDNDDDDDDNRDDIEVNVWWGPRNTVSPLHYDSRDNILCQVVGSKYIRLYDCKYSAQLYPPPQGSDTMTYNTSQISWRIDDDDDDDDDCIEGGEKLRAQRSAMYPDFPTTPYQEVVLHPGDQLFIPRGWWHYVRSLSSSASVSFWFGKKGEVR